MRLIVLKLLCSQGSIKKALYTYLLGDLNHKNVILIRTERIPEKFNYILKQAIGVNKGCTKLEENFSV